MINIYITAQVQRKVGVENVTQLSFSLDYFSNTFVCMSILETRKSEAIGLFRRMQTKLSFRPRNLDLCLFEEAVEEGTQTTVTREKFRNYQDGQCTNKTDFPY